MILATADKLETALVVVEHVYETPHATDEQAALAGAEARKRTRGG